MGRSADSYGVPIIGSHPWRAWWLGSIDRNKRPPRSIQEILEYFELGQVLVQPAEITKLEIRYQEGYWQLADRSDEPNGPFRRGES